VTITKPLYIPLHGTTGPPGSWWACSNPERPPDDGVRFDFRCPACRIAAEAALRSGFTRTTDAVVGSGPNSGRWTYKRSLSYWLHGSGGDR